MTSEWIAPKTDWEDGDYYQREDAERFVNNLNYLRTLGTPMVPDSSDILVAREIIGGQRYFSIYKISFNYSISTEIALSSYSQSSKVNYVSYDGLFNNMDMDNVHDIFKIGLEILFKLRSLQKYYVTVSTSYRGYNKYPLYMNDAKGDDDPTAWLYIDSSTGEKKLHKGIFLLPSFQRVPDPDEDLLDPLWKEVMHYSIPRPFSIYSSSEYINIQSRELLANQPFFKADVLNKIETYMLEVYNRFTTLRQTYPREDS